jgi:hypothetical protein
MLPAEGKLLRIFQLKDTPEDMKNKQNIPTLLVIPLTERYFIKFVRRTQIQNSNPSIPVYLPTLKKKSLTKINHSEHHNPFPQ